MNSLRSTLTRFLNLFRNHSRHDRELSAELASHLQLHIDDNLRAGLSPDEARRAALLKLGGLEQTKERVRDQRSLPFLETLFHDLHFAVRSLSKDRRLSLVAILALTLGIGASTIVFSVINSIYIDALPYKSLHRLVVFRVQNLANEGAWKGRNYFLPGELRAFRDENHVFEETITYNGIRLVYDNGRTTRYWPFGALVTGNTFDFFGVAPLLGRAISPDDARPAATPVFVMSYKQWQSEFAGDPKILNSVFILNDRPTTLIGIMPPDFTAFNASFWMPLTDTNSDGRMIGRLKPGASIVSAASDLDAIAHQVQKTSPNPAFPLPRNFSIIAETLLDSQIGALKATLYVLFAAVLLLLLIACANVANLLLARATIRERELAMRATLGATRARLIQQLIAESFALAAAGCLAGCSMAYFGVRLIAVLMPTHALPEGMSIRLNFPVLLIALCVALCTTILCGLAPVLYVLSRDLQPSLAAAGRSNGATARQTRLRSVLVVAEVAFSVILLLGSGLLLRSFLVLTRTDLGFDPHNVLFFRLSLPKPYNTDVDVTRVKKNALSRQMLEYLRSLPGVTSVAASMLEPPLESDFTDTIIPGKPHTERWETHEEACSSGYFELFGMALLRGRLFNRGDEAAARYVMVVNDTFARLYFPNEDPIGRKVKLDVLDRTFLDAPHNTYFEIVGIVSDFKTRDFDNPSWRLYPRAFIPYTVQGFSWRTYMARTSSDPGPLLKTIRKELETIDPNIEMSTSGTLEASLRDFYRGPQFELASVSSFAAIGLLLVVIGIASVMFYTVSQRTREVGIRMALGAQSREILFMVLASGFTLIALGLVLGVTLSVAAARLLASRISQISAVDPWTLLAVAFLVLLVGLVSCYLPARRASRTDPSISLRYE